MAKYGSKASEKVEKAMHERKKGTLKSGKSGKEGQEPEASDRYWTFAGSEGGRQGTSKEILLKVMTYLIGTCTDVCDI